MLLPRRADSVNYFLLGSAAIICIFHLAVIDVAGGREEGGGGGGGAHFVSQQLWDEKKMDSLTARSEERSFRLLFSHIPDYW